MEEAIRKKLSAVGMHGNFGRVRTEVSCKRERDAHLSGEPCAVIARPEQVKRRQRLVIRHCAHGAKRIVGRKRAATPGDELAELLEEIIGGQSLPRAAESEGSQRIGARRAPDAEIDPAGIDRFKELVRFGYLQRRVIRKHDAARAEPDARGHRAYVRDQDLRDGRRDTRHVVMLGVPQSRIAEAVNCLGQLGGGPQRGDAGAALYERNQVKRRQRERLPADLFAR
jgi:hypothetical protein